MPQEEPENLSASTAERFCFIMTPDLLHSSTSLSLKLVRKERRNLEKTTRRVMQRMSYLIPGNYEWCLADTHLRTITNRIEELNTLEVRALRSYSNFGNPVTGQ